MSHLDNLISYVDEKLKKFEIYFIVNTLLTIIALIFTVYVVAKEAGWLIAGSFTFIYLLTTVKSILQMYEEGDLD